MAKLIVIYDPSEKLQMNPELDDKLKLKTASVSLPNEMEYDDVRDAVETLASLLLKHI